MIKDGEKVCACCKTIQPIINFTSDRQKGDGLSSYCRTCVATQHRKYTPRNEKTKATQQRYYQSIRDSPEKLAIFRGKYRVHQRRYNGMPGGKFNNLKQRCKKRGTRFEISRSDFIEWFNEQSKVCHYCGCELGFGVGVGNDWDHLNIDKKDNDGGYTLDNITFACKRCNTIKGFWFTEIEMIEIANKYFKHE